jgi:hypothetical protein
MTSHHLSVLNAGAGDLKLSFDKDNPADRTAAAAVVKDMLRKGYAIMVKTGVDDMGRDTMVRVHDFDPDTCEYIIFGAPDSISSSIDMEIEHGSQPGNDSGVDRSAGGGSGAVSGTDSKPVSRRGKRPGKRIAADSTTAVAVGPVAGG